MGNKIRQTRTNLTMLLVLLLCVLGEVPYSYSQILNATLEVPSTVNHTTIYLSDNVHIVTSIVLDTENVESLDILWTLSDELKIKETSLQNSVAATGSNINISTIVVAGLTNTSCMLSLQNVAFINQSLDDALANQISFSFDAYASDAELGKGDILDISAYINYTLSLQSNHTSSPITLSKLLQYGGPEVLVLLDSDGFSVVANTTKQSVTLDRELQLSTSLMMPAMWSIQDVVVHLDLSSQPTLTNIPVEYLQCIVTSTSANVTFSNSTNTDVTDFNREGDTIRPSHHVSKRTVGDEAKLVWSIGDITNTGMKEADLTFEVRFLLSDSSDLVDGTIIDLLSYMDMNGVSIELVGYALVIREPQLSVTKTVSKTSYLEEGTDHSIQKVRFKTTVTHSADSMAEAYNVLIQDDVDRLYVEYFSPPTTPPFGTTGLTASTTLISLKQDKLAVGDTMELSYVAFLNDETVELKLETPFTFEADVTWISSDPNDAIPGYPGRSYGPITEDACLNQITSYEEDLILNHGLAALFFFVFLLVGFLLVIIIFLIWIKCCRKAPYAVVNPTRTTRAAKAGGLIINPGSNKKSALESIRDSSMVSIDDSVILVLALKDKGKKHVEFNNLDVWATIQMDVDLEKQRLAAMQECVVILIHQRVMEGQVSTDLEAKSVKKFQRNVKDMLKRLEDEYREECREVVKKLSVQNQRKLEQLRNKQKNQVNNAETNTKNLEKEKKKEIITLLEQQHQTEFDELTKLLKLQQDEELEKIRKEYAIKKRMELKGQQSAALDEVILQGELDEEQARGLIHDHRSNVATLEKLMDDEVSRQRMLLEEKLARRKAMAHANEIQNDEQRNLLNVLASQTLSPVQELQKDDKLAEDEALQYVERVKKEMLVAKEKADADRKKQEQALHKRLSEKKKKMMEQKAKEHQQQQEKLEKGFKINHEKDDIGCDDFLAANFTLMSTQREELFEIETELDEEAAKELETLRDGVVEKTKEQIEHCKGAIYKELLDKGLTEDMKDEIIEQHQRDVERLMEEREEQRAKQEKILKKKLAKHRQEWARKKQEEKVEQEQIREHENKMVDKLLATQMAVSEDERMRIMEEHEKQMVALENSLALGKLRQRRLIEEKQAARKARQLQKMEQEHQGEALRQMRKAQLDSDEEDSAQEAQQELMKKQVQERIAILINDDDDQLEEYQEQVHDQMVKERAQSLKKQEEKIGALMATLQLQKAREIATIEEQQKALWKLKLEMLDDMSEKGVIKNSECKKLVEAHAKQLKAAEEKIQSQKDKQEKELRKRLQAKMVEREKTFMARQEKELEELGDQERNSVAARLKRVALKHKHMVQIEEFRYKMEIEINQTLEELRRQTEVTRLKQKQEQELSFLAALVKYGKFDPVELRKVLQLLIPSKTDDDIQDMMARLYDKEEWDSEDELNNKGSQRQSNKQRQGTTETNILSLEDRVKAVLMGETLEMNQITESTLKKSKKAGKKGKLAPLKADQPKADPFATTFSGPALPSIQHRPEPLGCNASPDDDSELEIDRRAKYDTDSDEYGDDDAYTKRQRPSKKTMDYTY